MQYIQVTSHIRRCPFMHRVLTLFTIFCHINKRVLLVTSCLLPWITKPIQTGNWGLLLKERICSKRSKYSYLKVDLLLRIAKLLPIHLYQINGTHTSTYRWKVNCCMDIIHSSAPVAKWVKRWPTDLAVPSSIPARGKIFSTVNGAPLHTAFIINLSSSWYDWNTVEKDVKSQVIHPSIVRLPFLQVWKF